MFLFVTGALNEGCETRDDDDDDDECDCYPDHDQGLYGSKQAYHCRVCAFTFLDFSLKT